MSEPSRLTPLEKRIIHELTGDMGLGARPFKDIAERVGTSEEQVLAVIRDLKERRLMRRFGATLRHQLSGFTANAMVVWRVDPERVEEIGQLLASFREVSHCYHRPPPPGWPYNLYTMIHGSSKEDCEDQAGRMSARVGIVEYELLFSYKEMKKTSMRYFG